MRRLFLIVTLLWAVTAKADPGPVVKWLLDEPASVFDVGMMRLQRSLDLGEKEHLLFAQYKFEENRIYIRIFLPESNRPAYKSLEQMKSICRSLVIKAKGKGLVFDGDYFGGHEHSHFASLFSHIGYSNTKEPEDYRAKLDGIIVIDATASAKDGTKVQCRSPLMSKDIYFTE